MRDFGGNPYRDELPRERGRRPDVVMLAADTIVVLEFKDHHSALRPHIDQVASYARHLQPLPCSLPFS
jgi:hypothetical protein